MTEFDANVLLVRLFLALRRLGFDIGVSELLDAMRSAEGRWGASSEESLKEVIKLLWCNSVDEMHELEMVWRSVYVASTSATAEEPPEPPHQAPAHEAAAAPSDEESLPSWQSPEPAPDKADAREWAPLPVRAPFIPVSFLGSTELNSYWPVSRRFMAYVWRYLRRPVNDGPEDVLDVRMTVEKVAHQGFYLAPVYQRRTRNYAHLVLFIDQGGSMTPFHRFTRNIIETSQYESNIGRVDVLYFHNVISNRVYTDPFMTQTVAFEDLLEQCTNDTSVLIVSDAGAGRGHRRLERVNATTDFLYKLKQHTQHVAWLNPMPEERWAGTSAQILAHCIPMFQMDSDGLSNAIDVVRGQPLYHQHAPK